MQATAGKALAPWPGVVVAAAALGAAAAWASSRLIGSPSFDGFTVPFLAFLSGLIAALVTVGLMIAVTDSRLRSSRMRLRETASRWARGDLDARADLPDNDPMHEVGREFDRAAASLLERDEARLRGIEEQILQAERLATTGRLAAGVAHEINNPLSGILLCGDLIMESTPEDDPRQENLQRIMVQASRAREIVRGLLDFARETAPQIRRVDLNEIVRGVLRLLERQPLFQRVRVGRELSRAPLWVDADEAKIEQVLINIVMNGLEAMRAGDSLTVRSGYSEKGGYCRVAITDTGCGISAAHLLRLFEPFFTTKEVGQGVGLGLAICHGIVKQHRGEIEVQSTVGSGTTFRILLPVSRAIALEEA